MIKSFFFKLKKFDLERWYHKQKFNEKRQLEFLSYFATWLPSGSIAACNAIIDTGQNIRSRSLDVLAAKEIKKSLDRGSHVSAGLKELFSPAVCLLFTAAQESNRPEAMNHILQSYIQQENEIRAQKSTISKSLMYPAALVALGLVLNAGIGAFLLQVKETVGAEGFSFAGRLTVALGSFLTDYIGLAALVVVAFVVLGFRVASHYDGVYRKDIDRIFPFSLYKAFCVMRTMRILGLLLEYKSSVPQALNVLAVNSNPYVKSHLMAMLRKTSQSGTSVHKAMDTGFLMPELVYRLKLQMEHSDQQVRIKAVSHVADYAGMETGLKMKVISRVLVGLAYALGLAILLAGFGGYFEVMSLINSKSSF